jgi:hypothetical protein
VEYFYYFIVILALLALCLYLIRIPGQVRLTRKPVDLADRARKQRLQEKTIAHQESQVPPHHQRIIQRELRKVSTPWGWPGSDVRPGSLRGSQNGSSGSLRTWIDQLTSEKRTVDDSEYRLRKEASLRALLEDRFGRPARPGEVAYARVKPPQLRDPSRPYDQDDNFPSGRTDQIVAKLGRQPGKPKPVAAHAGLAQRDRVVRNAVGLKHVRTPWGW